MALIKCSECGQQFTELALSCPHCGAPPVVNTASARIVVTESSDHSASVFGSVRESLETRTAILRSANLAPRDVALLVGVICIVGGVFLPLIKRPAVDLLLSYYQHSHFSAGVLITLSLLGAAGHLLRRWWVTASAGIGIAIITTVVLTRLHNAFDLLVHPAMQFSVGTYLIMAGSLLLVAVTLFRGSAHATIDKHAAIGVTASTKLAPSSETKALFAAWLKQQGVSTEISLAERQSHYERYRKLHEQGELDLIGLRRILKEDPK